MTDSSRHGNSYYDLQLQTKNCILLLMTISQLIFFIFCFSYFHVSKLATFSYIFLTLAVHDKFKIN